MLVGILSDTHFGFNKFYEDSFKQGKKALETAYSLSDLVIIAGDIFDTRVPKLETLARTIEIFREVGKEKPVFAISGTHERRASDSINPVQLLEKSGLIIDISNNFQTYERNDEKVNIVGLGGVPDEYAKESIEALSPKPQKGCTNIFVFHQTIVDLVPSNGISFSDLPDGFDLYICGHIHKRFVEKRNGKLLIIPGSTVITQLRKEECDEKGIYLYDTLTKNYSFVPIPTRNFVYKEIHLEEADNLKIQKALSETIEKIKNEYRNKKSEDEKPIVKIKILGSTKKGLNREDIIIDIKDDDFYYFEVENSLDTKTLKEEIEVLRKMHEEKKNAKDLGLEILGEKIKTYDIKIDINEIFDTLSDEKNINNYIAKLLSKKT
jgi:DNA repair exonuclease SbcCD nuclease subunit